MEDEMFALLLAAGRFDVQTLRNTFSGYEPREFGLALWRARERMRKEHGVDFGPVRGIPGAFERKEWVDIAKRGERQRAKGTRAHRRAEERLRLASTLAPSEERDRLNDAADRIRLRMAMRNNKK
jgi:hypothetical protein